MTVIVIVTSTFVHGSQFAFAKNAAKNMVPFPFVIRTIFPPRQFYYKIFIEYLFRVALRLLFWLSQFVSDYRTYSILVCLK